MRSIPVILLSALTFISVHSQTLAGLVTDAQGEALSFATVSWGENGRSVYTEVDGSFVISWPTETAESLELRIEMLGYAAETRVFDPGDRPAEVQIILEPTRLDLDQVVITGTLRAVDRLDSPVPVEVYSRRFFKANPTPSIFESLQNVNGVRPQLNCNVCNTGDIHINGLEGPYTMVLLDGMPIVSGLSTVYGLTGIPQSLIDRIEVVKGPAATLYGSEAVGGLINIITQAPANAPRFSADAFVSDWGELNVDLGARFGLGQTAVGLLGINYFNFSQPIDRNDDGFTDLTLQDRLSVFGKLDFRRSSAKAMSLAFRYLYEDRWGGETDWTSADRGGDQVYGESIYTNRWEMIGKYEFDLPTDLSYQLSANGHYQNSYYGDLFYQATQYVLFNQLLWRPRVSTGHDLLIGAALRHTYYDDNTPATAAVDDLLINQPDRVVLPGLFAQDEITLGPLHKVLLGLRYDHDSRHGGIWSPRANYQYRSRDRNTTVRLSVGNGFRVANIFTEDHAALTGAREVVFAEELRPERSWNANLNLERRFFLPDNAFLNIDASLFYTHFQNRILPDYDSHPDRIIYANLNGFGVSRGASLRIDYRKGGFSVNAGVTTMEVFTNEGGIRERPVLTEGFNGVWGISQSVANWGLSFDYTGNLYGPMRLPLLGPADPRPAESPWFSIQNLKITKALGIQTEVYFGMKNILNFTPAANSIARPQDPFDRQVEYDAAGEVMATADNPYALTFDPSYVYASNQGRRLFVGFSYTFR